MTGRPLRVLETLLLAGFFVLGVAPAASAACHSFDVEVSPSTVEENGGVTVTVSRDNALDDSSVHVSAVSGTAQSGADFSPLNQQVNFTGNSTERSFQVAVEQDGVAEGAENFTVRLSNPGGCQRNPNFRLAEPVTVTISASRAAPAPAPPPPPAPAPAPAPPPPPARPPAPPPAAASPTTTEEPTPEPTETATALETPAPDDSDRGGGVPLPLVGGVLALVAAAGVAAWLVKQHRTPPPV